MKCEGKTAECKHETKGYELFDYCERCSKNLCAACMRNGKCHGVFKHQPANHGEAP